MNWKQRVPGCFGAQDLKWGSHVLDQQRAKQMLKDAIDAGATMAEIVAEAQAYLQGKGALAQHIRDQIDKIRDLSF
jgi:succinate dehydrogenase/fumarate reductase flavoprotein subunit